MSLFNQKDIDLFAQKILEDYDLKDPGKIFKNKIQINNTEALLIQSTVSKLRKKRGEETIGYKIGCVLKETQKKMGFTQPAWGTLWQKELHTSGVSLNKKDYSNPAMEAEFGIILNRDLKPELISFEYILESIESIYPLIEIHNLVFLIFYLFLVIGRISVITLMPVIGVIMMMVSVTILSRRENMSEFNNSLDNIEKIDTLK